jgi:drug/metabolite transporter (DMT)-like permease
VTEDYAVTQILATRSLVAFAPLFILLHLDGGLRGVNGRRLGRLLMRAALLFAAALYALAQVMARDLGTTHRASVMALAQNAVNLAAALAIGLVAGDGAYAGAAHPSLAFLLRAWTIPTTVDLLLMAATGVIAAVAIWLLTQAYRIAEANVIAPFEYTSIVWVVLLAYLIWGEVPEPFTIVGGLLIVAAGIYVLRAARRSR